VVAVFLERDENLLTCRDANLPTTVDVLRYSRGIISSGTLVSVYQNTMDLISE